MLRVQCGVVQESRFIVTLEFVTLELAVNTINLIVARRRGCIVNFVVGVISERRGALPARS
jgi:hypothetical protein